MNDIKDSTITGLDEETAFDPSEFFENEEVEATFNKVIEADKGDSSERLKREKRVYITDYGLMSIYTEGGNEHDVWDFLETREGLSDDLKMEIFNFLAPDYINGDEDDKLLNVAYELDGYPLSTSIEILELFCKFSDEQKHKALCAFADIEELAAQCH